MDNISVGNNSVGFIEVGAGVMVSAATGVGEIIFMGVVPDWFPTVQAD
jgi:hypothetical protein